MTNKTKISLVIGLILIAIFSWQKFGPTSSEHIDAKALGTSEDIATQSLESNHQKTEIKALIEKQPQVIDWGSINPPVFGKVPKKYEDLPSYRLTDLPVGLIPGLKEAWLEKLGYPNEQRKQELMVMNLEDLNALARRGDIAAMSHLGLRLGMDAQTDQEKLEAIYWLDEATFAGSGLGALYHAQLRDMYEPLGMDRSQQLEYREATMHYYGLAGMLGDPNGFGELERIRTTEPQFYMPAHAFLRTIQAGYAGILLERQRRGLPALVTPPAMNVYPSFFSSYWGQATQPYVPPPKK